ncbi:VOC family protein [Mycobacterium colombiense]
MRGIDCVIRYVESLDQSVAFYRDVVALKVRIADSDSNILEFAQKLR